MPAHLKGEAHLVLQYGHDLPIAIPDLRIDEHGVNATLSFARTPWPTFVPWSAVYVVTSDDGRGVLYQEDVPGDVSVIAAKAPEAGVPHGSKDGNASVDSGAPSPEAVAEAMATDGAAAARPPSVTPTRTLRAVPATGTFGSAGEIPLDLPKAADDELGPARRRKRPQLRLVK